MKDDNAERKLTNYTDSGFAGRSAIAGLIFSALIYWLSDASDWQLLTITAVSFIFFMGISIQQATLIENLVMTIIITGIVWGVSTTEHFDFHWSVVLISFLAGLNGMGGNESRKKHQYRIAYGDEEFIKKYGDD